MADPSRPVSNPVPVFARGADRPRAAIVLLILELALCVRIAAAVLIELYLRHKAPGQLCLFPDTRIYWGLAREIRLGAPLVYIEYADIPHFALRTPGYPLFLAIFQAVFGESTLGVRLVQAVLGVVCVYLVYRLAGQFTDAGTERHAALEPRPRRFSGPVVAAAIAAISPFYVFMSTVLLSEALFEPLLLATLLGWTVLWKTPAEAPNAEGWRRSLLALASGAAAGAAVLVRPSWALFVPAALGTWTVAAIRQKRQAALAVGLSALGFAITMAPWWVRNARIFGRFVGTALWLGASLYDGLNTNATGASEMSFLEDPAISRLDEQDQDAELARRAIAFAREHPVRVLGLAVAKLGRYWSPWPHAQGPVSPVVAVASTMAFVPVFGLIAAGAWSRRRDPRAVLLLAGPLIYFCALHVFFASSMRYRAPAEMPALALLAIGWDQLLSRLQRRRS
jgi:4-amino-4-deoxy-L-arabinose transferase-like glycosyltransferase